MRAFFRPEIQATSELRVVDRMIVTHVDHCLRCGYPLDGLPASHVCPECGLAYDGETIVFRPMRRVTRSRTEQLADVFRILATILWIALLFVGMFNSDTTFVIFALLFGGISAPDLIAMFQRRRQSLRCGFVAVSQDALLAMRPGGPFCRMPYEDIWDIEVSSQMVRSKPGLEFERSTPYTRSIGIADMFDDDGELQEFVRRVEARMGRDIGSAGPRGTSDIRIS